MYDLLYGKVALCVDYGTDEDVMVSRNEAPAFFGEVGLLDSLPRFATSVALEESVCRIIRHEEFSEYFIKNRQRSSACFKSIRKALHSIQTLQRGVPYLRRVRHNGKERPAHQRRAQGKGTEIRRGREEDQCGQGSLIILHTARRRSLHPMWPSLLQSRTSHLRCWCRHLPAFSPAPLWF